MKKREFPFADYNSALHEKYGNMARFVEGSMVPVDWQPQEFDNEFPEWQGYPEVVGTNGNLAGVLIDEETITVFDMVQETIVDTDEKVTTAFHYSLRNERDKMKQAEIMALYQRLVSRLLKLHTRAAG